MRTCEANRTDQEVVPFAMLARSVSTGPPPYSSLEQVSAGFGAVTQDEVDEAPGSCTVGAEPAGGARRGHEVGTQFQVQIAGWSAGSAATNVGCPASTARPRART